MKKRNKKSSKRRNRRILGNVILSIAIIALFGWYAFQYMNLESKALEKEQELKKLEEELTVKKKELNKKNMEVNYYQSDENIEKIAREELGLVMPQEIVFIQSN